MKILYLYQYYCTPEGSWGTRVYEFTRRWQAEGNEVTVISAPYEKSDMPKRRSSLSVEGVNVEIYNTPDDNRKGAFVRTLNALRFMLVCVNKVVFSKYDIVISSSGPISLGVPLIFAKTIRRKKTIFEVRDLWPGAAIGLNKIQNSFIESILWKLEKLTYQKADLIITASPGQLQNISSRFNRKIACIPNASDNILFSSEGRYALPTELLNKKILLHIGSLGFIHNCFYWIEVMRHLRNTDIHLVFIGDGADRSELEHYVKMYALSNIHFTGLIPKVEMTSWTKKALATVFSTIPDPLQETCSPNKVFDSFAAGLPVIQTTKGWIGELISKENTGINVDPYDPASAAVEIEKLLKEPERLAEMSRAAQRLAETDFNRDLLAKRYLELLEELVEK